MGNGNRKTAGLRFLAKGVAFVCFFTIGNSDGYAQLFESKGITFSKEISVIKADMEKKRYTKAFALALEFADKSGAILADSGLDMKQRSAAANDHQAFWELISMIHHECRDQELQQKILTCWDARLKDHPYLFLQLLPVDIWKNRSFVTDRFWRLFNGRPCYETFLTICAKLAGGGREEDLVRTQALLDKTKNKTRQVFLYIAQNWIRWRRDGKNSPDPGPPSYLIMPDFISTAKELEKKALHESKESCFWSP